MNIYINNYYLIIINIFYFLIHTKININIFNIIRNTYQYLNIIVLILLLISFYLFILLFT